MGHACLRRRRSHLASRRAALPTRARERLGASPACCANITNRRSFHGGNTLRAPGRRSRSPGWACGAAPAAPATGDARFTLPLCCCRSLCLHCGVCFRHPPPRRGSCLRAVVPCAVWLLQQQADSHARQPWHAGLPLCLLVHRGCRAAEPHAMAGRMVPRDRAAAVCLRAL